MVTLSPLASGLLEGTVLALLGVILFQLRHRAGLMPFVFMLGGLALTIPFISHLTPLQLAEPWTISRAYAVVLPVFVTLALLLHTFIGSVEARIAASLPALGGLLVGAATLASHLFPIVLPQALLPSPAGALASGAVLAIASLAAIQLFELWHRHVEHAPAVAVIIVSGLAGVLVHGLLHEALAWTALDLGGGRWPAIVAVPLVTGLAPISFVAIYTEVLLDDLAPIAQREDPDARDLDPRDLERVRDAEARFRDALSWIQEANRAVEERPAHQPVGVFVAAPDGRLLHVNDAMGWMFGRAPEEMIGRDASQLLFDPRDPGADDPTRRLPELSPGTHTTTITLPDGEERTLELSLTRTPEGALRGEVDDRTADALRREADRHRERARFAMNMLTRDLPNYLAAPRSLVDALVDRTANGTDPTSPSSDGTTETASREHATGGRTTDDPATPRWDAGASTEELTRRLDRSLADAQEALDRIRPLSELEHAPRETVDLDAMLRDAVQALPHEVLDSLSIRWKMPSTAVPATGSDLLGTAFKEIVDNVATHAGEDATVTIRVGRDRGYWVVTIADDGPGIPHELKGRIFEGFRQGSDGRGAGIGLYLARAIVEDAGGELRVEDRIPERPDEGAAFHVRLPVAEGATTARGIDVLLGPEDDAAPASA